MGITTMPVLQSLAQARTAGAKTANAIWDALITKIILGGASNSRDCKTFRADRRTRRVH